jgi:hypothetical protein
VWPVATNPIIERDYLDPGSVVITQGPSPFTIPRHAVTEADALGRSHPANDWFYDPAAQTDTDTYLIAHARYDVVFTGGGELGAQVFDDIIYLPQSYALQSPDVAPYALAGGVDHAFTFAVQNEVPPVASDPDYRLQSVVGFTGPDGPAVMCVEPADGSIIVPAAMAAAVRAAYPSGGTLIRQTYTHVIRRLVVGATTTCRRIDFIGVYSFETPFTVP